MIYVLAICNAIAAIPKIGALFMQMISGITVWFMQQQNNEALAAIQDAAALQARAKTDADRYAAAQAWQSALSKPVVTLN